MTLAAVDRLVHHATIFEMNVDSYRRRSAIERKQHGAGRPPQHATIKSIAALSLSDNQPETYRLPATNRPTTIRLSRSPLSSRNTEQRRVGNAWGRTCNPR